MLRLALLSSGLLLGCSVDAPSGTSPAPAASNPWSSRSSTDVPLVVGVETADLGVPVGGYVVYIGGNVIHQTVRVETLPIALEVDGAEGARVDVKVLVISPLEFSINPWDPRTYSPVLERTATTRLLAGPKRLLRIRLDPRCIPSQYATSSTSGAACEETLTCVAGACVSPDVEEGGLEVFSPTWTTVPSDDCRPAAPGPPELILGTGQNDYAPLADGESLKLQGGPQGGHHLWMALRMKNLRQLGSMITLTATMVDEPMVIAPFTQVGRFDAAEAGYCKLSGLRYQLDSTGQSYRDLLGKTLMVTADVVDSTGARATSSRRVRVADTILCFGGTDACNRP